jgi:signal transduction histidine kinase
MEPNAAEVFVGTSEMAGLMRATDWSATVLGSVSGWPHSLRAAIRLMLTSRFPMWLGWGTELTFFYNDAYGAMSLGAKHPWALGQPSSAVWREIWSELSPRIERVLEKGVATWDESLLLFLERSGYPEETYHTFSYSPVHDDDGVIRGNFCVVTEETERAIGERRLALLKALAEKLSAANTTRDVCNAVARAIETDPRDLPFTLTYLGNDASPVLALASQTGIEHDHPALRDEQGMSPWPLERVLATGQAALVSLPQKHLWPTGPWSRAPSRVLALPIAQPGQRPFGVFVTALNPHRPLDDTYRSFFTLLVGQLAAGITSARAYEEERRKAEALAELDRAKTTFFSNVSHEFRTPLTLILAPLDELRARAELPEVVRSELGLVQRNGLRLLRLVNTLLDFSRIEAGRVQARYEPVDLARQTAELTSLFESAIERAGLKLKVDCAKLAAPVYVDQGMWEKIVLNLMSNALKFTFDGEIEASLRQRDGHAELTVRDTGTGIPEHEIAHLFERFHRVEGARGRTHEGTGIGLALVHELVKLHGGSVHVESELGRGSAFTVSIPLGHEHLPIERVHQATSALAKPAAANPYVEEALTWLRESAHSVEPSRTTHDSVSGSSVAKRIVLADDNSDMREYIRRLLAPFWEIEAVQDGRTALESIRRKRPALLITDVMMPELDGFGLLQAVRSDPQLSGLPVLMLSARAGEESRLEGIERGADDYLAKPFTARELIARIEAQLLRTRVRAVEEAHARRLASVFAQAPTAIALLRGPDHVFELANPLYLELINHRKVVGLALGQALPELVEQGIVALLDQVYRTGEAVRTRSLPVELNRVAGGAAEQCIFDFVYQPMLNDDGQVEGIAVVANEVTELAIARKLAEVASVAKDEFFAMLGHELRNPLMPIMTALELIKQRGDTSAHREHRIIERQVSHLVTLVDDLLDVSRITRGKLQLNKTRLELHEVIAKAIETASPLLEKQRHTLHVAVPASGLAVDADPGRLAQVFANLINNAAKYTEPGGRVSIAGQREGDEAVIRVRDTGIGIAPEMLSKVFDLFAQERQALDRAQGGLGLGLAIVQSLVRLHGGTVAATSDGPGQGAELTVRLALAPSEQASAQRPSAVVPAALPSKGSKRVLVVDDNEDIALMISELLSAWGYEARYAHDAISALALAESFQPDAAVLDIGLPVIDGYELAKRFVQHPKLRHIRLVAVTGYGQEEDRRRARTAGFVEHLVKPVDLERLRRAIDASAEPARQAAGK